MGGRRRGAMVAAVALAAATWAGAASADACGRGCGCGRRAGRGEEGGAALRGGRGPGRASAGPLAPMDEAGRAAVEEALADERRTEALYSAVVAAHGEVRPFSNAVHAEARHAALLEATLAGRGLAIPERPAAAAAAGGAVADACAAAVAGERANVELYDRLLAAGPLPDDVKAAFEHNRWASLERHLPAFERCVARMGGRR